MFPNKKIQDPVICNTLVKTTNKKSLLRVKKSFDGKMMH